MINRLLDWIDRISTAAGAVSAVLIAVIALLILSEVTARAVFNYSIGFAWEYSSYCMAAVIFGGASFALRTGAHVRVSLLSAAAPPRVAWALDLVATLLGVAIAGFLAYALTGLAISSLGTDSRSVHSTATPLAIPQGAMAIGAMLFVVQLLARLTRLLLRQAPDLQAGENVFAMDQ